MIEKPKLLFVTAVALAVTACSDPSWNSAGPARYCVDAKGVRVPDNQCGRGAYATAVPYNWYYVGHGGYVPYVGEPWDGRGSYRPAHNVRYDTAPSTYTAARSYAESSPSSIVSRGSTSVPRGGFGASSVSRGSFGGS